MSNLATPEEILERVRAWRSMMLGDDGTPHSDACIALEDLRIFCHAQKSTAHTDDQGRIDPLAVMELEGRRQVWLRIVGVLFANDEDLAAVAAEVGGY